MSISMCWADGIWDGHPVNRGLPAGFVARHFLQVLWINAAKPDEWLRDSLEFDRLSKCLLV